jgi:hypothetical protein
VRVGIHQPNFLPWRGFFSKIQACDTFVLLDDVQFERGKTFTSRTKIALNGTALWLTIPVLEKSKFRRISEIQVDPSFAWKRKHLNTLFHAYKKTLGFSQVFPAIERVYDQPFDFLVQYNLAFIESIASCLELEVDFVRSSTLPGAEEAGWDKIKCILVQTQAQEYISGSGAGSKRYVNEQELQSMGINVVWQSPPQQEYVQPHSPHFMPDLSVVDFLFNTCPPYFLS